MARKTSRRHAQGDASRKTILDATLGIAGERGYVGTTMSRVEQATGLSASSLYWHFTSKDELLMAALDHGYLLWRRRVPRWDAAAPNGALVDALVVNLRAGADQFDDEPGFWRMGLLLGLESGPAVGSGPRERFLQIRADALGHLQAWWSTVLDTTPDLTRMLAQFTLATLDGLFIRHQSEGPGDLDALLRLLATGLAETARRVAAAGSMRIYGPPRRPPYAPALVLAAEPASSRSRLLEAAYRVASESGYEGATISRICAVAGLPASSLYWHFKDKDDLFAAAVEHSYRQWELNQPVWLPPRPGVGWRDELRHHMLVTSRSLVDQPAFLRLGYLLLLLRRNTATSGRDRFVGVRARVQLLVEAWFRETVGDGIAPGQPRLLAQLMMAVFDGLFFSACLDDGPWEPTAFADLMHCLLSSSFQAEVRAVAHPAV